VQCSRYIETNPVRAGLADRPGEYRWSSFKTNAFGQPDALLRRHGVYLALGRSESTRRKAYRALFDTPLDAALVDAIRRATNKGIVLGFDRERSHLERALRRPISRGKHGGHPRRRAAD
jgi:putative transposase